MRNRSDQRGFSLIIVFLLMIIMVGVAATVLIASQGDLQISAIDRSANSAFYIAERAVAFAKEDLWDAVNPPAVPTPTPPGPGMWNNFLTNPGYVNRRCVLATTPGCATLPTPPECWAAPPGWTTQVQGIVFGFQGGDTTEYSYCMHNNASDPNYLTPPRTIGDTTDSDGIVTIEAFGQVINGSGYEHKHLTVDVATGSVSFGKSGEYSQAGGGARKGGRADSTVAPFDVLTRTF